MKKILPLVVIIPMIAAGWWHYKTNSQQQQTEQNIAKPTLPTTPSLTQTSLTATHTSKISKTNQQSLIPSIQPSIVERAREIRKQRDAEITRLRKLPVDKLIDELFLALANNQTAAIHVGQGELLTRMQEDPEAVNAIKDLLDHADSSQQKYLLWLLAEAASPLSLASLLDFAQNSPDNIQRDQALHDIAQIGQHRDHDGKYPTQLSPVLKQYLDPKGNEILYNAVMSGLASVGSKQNVEKLFQIIQTDGNQALAPVIYNVRNPEAIEPLQHYLQTDPNLATITGLTAGHTLAAMGQVEATRALLHWASGITDTQQAQQAVTWLSQVRDYKSLELLLNVNLQTFQNKMLQQQISEIAQEKERITRPISLK